MRKIVFIVVLLCVIGFTVVYITVQPKGGIYQNISPRAKEYIKEQLKKKNVFWGEVALVGDPTKPKTESERKVIIDNCFEMVLPFPVRFARQQANCHYVFLINNPHGEVVMYQQKVEMPSLDEDSNVRLRRLKKDEYVESSMKIEDLTFVVFTKRSQMEYEKSAFLLNGDRYTVINLKVPTNKNLDPKFASMMNTLVFYHK